MRRQLLLVLCAVVSQHIIGAEDQEQDYGGYVKALEVFKLAFDFSTEETNINPIVNPVFDFKWANVSWVVGLRGRTVWGKWYEDAECMGALVTTRLALVPCMCIWSWYKSFLGKPLGTGKFAPASPRTENDITVGELFLYHTLHPPLNAVDDYFREELTRYYSIVNEPLESYECKKPVPGNEFEHRRGVALIELQVPVYEGNNVPVMAPYDFIDDDYYHDYKTKPLRVLAFAVKFANPNHLFVPRYAIQKYREKHERWRTWSNTGRLRNELVSVDIEPLDQGCPNEYLWTHKYDKELECWKVTPDSGRTISNYIAGAIVVTANNELYGMVMNWIIEPEFFPVRRLTSSKYNTILNLVSKFEDRQLARKKNASENDKSLRLFHDGLGEINYDEDFDPYLLYKVEKDVILQSGAPPKSVLTSTMLAASMVSVWFHHLRQF